MESTTINNNINIIKVVRKLFNDVRSNLSHEKTKRIRKKLHRIGATYNVLKEKEQKGSLTSRQKNMLRNDERYLKNISIYLKNLKRHFKKYQYGLDFLFNEPATSNNDTSVFQEVRNLLNERKSNLLLKETNKIRKKLYKKEAVYNFLKKKEQNGSLTNSEKKVLKKIEKYLKNFKKDLDRLQKYQHIITYGLDYLFKKLNEDYYKPAKVKSAFDDTYVLYESRGDRDNMLAPYEYFDNIRLYLKDMMDNYKAKGE